MILKPQGMVIQQVKIILGVSLKFINWGFAPNPKVYRYKLPKKKIKEVKLFNM